MLEARQRRSLDQTRDNTRFSLPTYLHFFVTSSLFFFFFIRSTNVPLACTFISAFPGERYLRRDVVSGRTIERDVFRHARCSRSEGKNNRGDTPRMRREAKRFAMHDEVGSGPIDRACHDMRILCGRREGRSLQNNALTVQRRRLGRKGRFTVPPSTHVRTDVRVEARLPKSPILRMRLTPRWRGGISAISRTLVNSETLPRPPPLLLFARQTQ